MTFKVNSLPGRWKLRFHLSVVWNHAVIAEVNQTLADSGRNGMGTPGFGIPPNEVDFGVVLAAVPAMHRLGTTSINASLAPASAARYFTRAINIAVRRFAPEQRSEKCTWLLRTKS